MVVFLPAPIYKVKYLRDGTDLGAGKHPSPLGKKKKKKKIEKKWKNNCPRHYLAESFWIIEKYCSYQKLY